MMKKKLVPITLRTVINISSFVWTNEPPGRFPLVQYKSAFFFGGGVHLLRQLPSSGKNGQILNEFHVQYSFSTPERQVTPSTTTI